MDKCLDWNSISCVSLGSRLNVTLYWISGWKITGKGSNRISVLQESLQESSGMLDIFSLNSETLKLISVEMLSEDIIGMHLLTRLTYYVSLFVDVKDHR